MKTSLGIWAFGPMVTRFVPGGYQPQHAGESTVERLRRAVEGLGDLIDGYEFHYPQELNEDNVDAIRASVAAGSPIPTPRHARRQPALQWPRPIWRAGSASR